MRDLIVLDIIKQNPLFFHSISCKNNGFLFTTPNILNIKQSNIKNYITIIYTLYEKNKQKIFLNNWYTL